MARTADVAVLGYGLAIFRDSRKLGEHVYVYEELQTSPPLDGLFTTNRPWTASGSLTRKERKCLVYVRRRKLSSSGRSAFPSLPCPDGEPEPHRVTASAIARISLVDLILVVPLIAAEPAGYKVNTAEIASATLVLEYSDDSGAPRKLPTSKRLKKYANAISAAVYHGAHDGNIGGSARSMVRTRPDRGMAVATAALLAGTFRP